MNEGTQEKFEALKENISQFRVFLYGEHKTAVEFQKILKSALKRKDRAALKEAIEYVEKHIQGEHLSNKEMQVCYLLYRLAKKFEIRQNLSRYMEDREDLEAHQQPSLLADVCDYAERFTPTREEAKEWHEQNPQWPSDILSKQTLKKLRVKKPKA